MESRIWSIEQRHFQLFWTTSTPVEYLRNGTICRHSLSGILIRTYTRRTQQCHFEWRRVILSDLAKIFNDKKRSAVSLRQLRLSVSRAGAGLTFLSRSTMLEHDLWTSLFTTNGRRNKRRKNGTSNKQTVIWQAAPSVRLSQAGTLWRQNSHHGFHLRVAQVVQFLYQIS